MSSRLVTGVALRGGDEVVTAGALGGVLVPERQDVRRPLGGETAGITPALGGLMARIVMAAGEIGLGHHFTPLLGVARTMARRTAFNVPWL